MKEIMKKVYQEYFEAIVKGEKTFEVRIEDDCHFEEGDILILKEIDDKGEFTGREIKKKIGTIFRTKEGREYWKEEDIDKYGFTVLSLKVIGKG
jgi:ASC-1-like (ASCH) protein